MFCDNLQILSESSFVVLPPYLSEIKVIFLNFNF